MRIALTAGLVLAAAAAAGQIRVPVDESALNARIVQMDGMDRIVLPGARTVFPEGAPDLPGTAAAYVLPQGTELVDARIEGARYEPMGRYDLATVRMVPIGDEPGAYLYDQAWLEGGIYPESPVVDFHTGRKPQAPDWMQRSGLEWLFRLLTEPGRLWRRYLINNPLFITLVLAQALGLKRYSLERAPRSR